jgi:hypothetical protein
MTRTVNNREKNKKKSSKNREDLRFGLILKKNSETEILTLGEALAYYRRLKKKG